MSTICNEVVLDSQPCEDGVTPAFWTVSPSSGDMMSDRLHVATSLKWGGHIRMVLGQLACWSGHQAHPTVPPAVCARTAKSVLCGYKLVWPHHSSHRPLVMESLQNVGY
jgi:trehalose utilization protein